MKIALRLSLVLPLVLAGTQVASGCVAVAAGAAGAAGYAWYRGEFEGSLDGSPKKCAAAAKEALEDLDMKMIKVSATDIDGKVTARSALDKEVVVTIQRKTEQTCTVAIRIGTFGDEALSQNIFEKMKKNL